MDKSQPNIVKTTPPRFLVQLKAENTNKKAETEFIELKQENKKYNGGTQKNMLKEKDYKVLGYFRKDARTTLTSMSRRTRIPVSTIFDKLKRFEKRGLIKKHTSIVNFKELGYDVRATILILCEDEQKEKVKETLQKNKKINSLTRINNGYDFICEAIFEDMEQYDEFTTMLRKQPIQRYTPYFVMEDVKKEDFLTYNEVKGVNT